MHTKKQPAAAINKPFLLICLFVASTLTATMWQGQDTAHDAQQAATAPVQMADAGLPSCGMAELSLTAQCKPKRDA